jgi:hypothetical protein
VGIAIGLFLILFCYVTFSWWNWWYGGSLGCRPLIDVYVYLAIGLAYSYQYFVNQNKYFIKYIGASVALICVVYGLKLNVQGFYEWIHWDGMTYTSWKKSIWMYKIDKTYLDAMERPNEKKQLETGEEY